MLEGVSGIFAPDDGIGIVNVSRVLHSMDPPTAVKVDRRERVLQQSIDVEGIGLFVDGIWLLNRNADGGCCSRALVGVVSGNCGKAFIGMTWCLCRHSASLKHMVVWMLHFWFCIDHLL